MPAEKRLPHKGSNGPWGRVAAIGGINASNVAAVIEAGADMVCVISAVGRAPDPAEAARELVDLIDRARS